MSTKRILRWGIILFLLAALPVMTVALAQGQEPVKQSPARTEVGESAAPEGWDQYESESNNTRATADDFYYGYGVMGGEIGYAGDVDYFAFEVDFDEYYFLFDIDAQSINSSLDPIVCLQDRLGNNLGCNDDSDGLDSLLFYNAGDVAYIMVTDYDNDDGGSSYDYELLVSVPILVSAAPGGLGTGYVDGIPFQSGDVLAYSDFGDSGDKWVMLFDASDVGVNTLANLAHDTKDQFLFSVGVNQSIPGLGTVKPWDVLSFDSHDPDYSADYWQQLGPKTAGQFAMYLKGSQKQLTTSAEKVDAIDLSSGYLCGGNNLLVSTAGVATVTGQNGVMKQDDEDVFCLKANGRWDWALDINGNNDGPNPVTLSGMPAEDVFAMAYFADGYGYALTIAGTGRIDGLPFNQKDIFLFDGATYVDYYWRGPQHGWNYNLDAIEVGRGGW